MSPGALGHSGAGGPGGGTLAGVRHFFHQFPSVQTSVGVSQANVPQVTHFPCTFPVFRTQTKAGHLRSGDLFMNPRLYLFSFLQNMFGPWRIIALTFPRSQMFSPHFGEAKKAEDFRVFFSCETAEFGEDAGVLGLVRLTVTRG